MNHEFSPRERETLEFIARGLADKEIARELNVHPNTVCKWVTGICDKTEAHGRRLVVYAVRWADAQGVR